MYSERKSNFESFQGASDAEVGFGKDAVSSKVIEYQADNGQRIGVFVTEPLSGSDKTLIMPQQHDYRNEPLSMRRAEILATHTGSRVAQVEMPGTTGLVYADNSNPLGYSIYDSRETLPGSRQTLSQLKGALRGDFREHAAVQLDAVTETLGLTDKEPLVLFGESMGAPVSAALAHHIGERGLQLNTLVLHEAVNTFKNKNPLWLVSLLKNLGGIESDRRNEYFAENAWIDHPIAAFEQQSDAQKRLDSARKSLTQQAFSGLANGVGMRTGLEISLADTLTAFGKSNQPNVLLSKGIDSTVANMSDYAGLSEYLGENGINSTTWEFSDMAEKQPIGHFFLMSLGRQAVQARQLGEYINANS